MLKISILCLLITITFAKTPTWLGEWFVYNEDFFGTSSWPVTPQNGTVTLISASSTGAGLQLEGLGNNDKNMTWPLNWTAHDTNPNVCNQSECIHGSLLTTDKGITYANITWREGDGVSSIVLTPLQKSWLGSWYVLQSSTQNQSLCATLAIESYASISWDNEAQCLKLIGWDGNPFQVAWFLCWNPTDLSVNFRCNADSSFCQGGSIIVSDWAQYANIQWSIQSANCSAQLIRVTPQSQEELANDEELLW